MEHIIPPFSILIGLSGLGLGNGRYLLYLRPKQSAGQCQPGLDQSNFRRFNHFGTDHLYFLWFIFSASIQKNIQSLVLCPRLHSLENLALHTRFFWAETKKNGCEPPVTSSNMQIETKTAIQHERDEKAARMLEIYANRSFKSVRSAQRMRMRLLMWAIRIKFKQFETSL